MTEILSIEEIESRFDSEWILVEDPELDPHLKVLRGTVVWHSKDRDEVHQKLLELRPRHPALFHTGRMPEGTAIVL